MFWPSGNGRINAEHISLHLPSHMGRSWCNRNAAEDLAKAELRLREGQLNDSLHHIRIALGHKSYLFRNNVRPARTETKNTCMGRGTRRRVNRSAPCSGV